MGTDEGQVAQFVEDDENDDGGQEEAEAESGEERDQSLEGVNVDDTNFMVQPTGQPQANRGGSMRRNIGAQMQYSDERDGSAYEQNPDMMQYMQQQQSR